MSSYPSLVRQDGLAVSPSEFAQKFVNREWSVFVGSGICAYQYGQWHDLVASLCQSCGLNVSIPNDCTADALQLFAQEAYNRSPDCFREEIARQFVPRAQGSLCRGYIPIIGMNFNSIFTTNFDSDLFTLNEEVVSPKERREVFEYPTLRTTRVGSGGIFYLHGRPGAKTFVDEHLVLTKRSFDSAYKNKRLTQLLHAMWTEENLVIVGAKLVEPELKRLLEQAQRSCRRYMRVDKAPPPSKVIILPRRKDEVFPEIQYYRQTLGLEVLTYNAKGADSDEIHDELHCFLNEVRNCSPRARDVYTKWEP